MADRVGTPKRDSKVENSVKATEVGILIVLETFCGLKLTCMGIFARDHRVKVTINFQSKAQQESVKRSNINNGKILRNSSTSSYWPSSKKEKKKNKVTANFFLKLDL